MVGNSSHEIDSLGERPWFCNGALNEFADYFCPLDWLPSWQVLLQTIGSYSLSFYIGGIYFHSTGCFTAYGEGTPDLRFEMESETARPHSWRMYLETTFNRTLSSVTQAGLIIQLRRNDFWVYSSLFSLISKRKLDYHPQFIHVYGLGTFYRGNCPRFIISKKQCFGNVIAGLKLFF